MKIGLYKSSMMRYNYSLENKNTVRKADLFYERFFTR